MSRAEIRRFLLEGTRTAKLATATRDGHPHVVPIWFVLDGEEIVFTTNRGTVKGRYLRRETRVALCVDDEQPPFAFVHVLGHASAVDGDPELLGWATRIAERYMGREEADAYGRRNAAPGELLVRVVPKRIIARADIAGW